MEVYYMYNMDNERKAYSEVDDFIELLEEEDRNKIPKKLRDFFKREKNPYLLSFG